MAKPGSRRDTYSQMTRTALLDAGRTLFVRQGFSAVSAEALVSEAGLTRGALYHHFDGKVGLFEAVLEEFERRAVLRIEAAIDATSGSALDHALAGLDAFLDICTDDAYRRVVLQDGPLALGSQRWLEVDRRHFSKVLRTLVQGLQDEAVIAAHPVDLLASTFFAILTQMGTWIAEAGDQAEARRQATTLARAFISGLA